MKVKKGMSTSSSSSSSSRSSSPIRDDLADVRRDVYDMCDRQYPMTVSRNAQSLDFSPRTPHDPNGLAEIAKCTRNVTDHMDKVDVPLGKGAHGEVRVLKGLPDVAIKRTFISPLEVIDTAVPTDSLALALQQTDSTTREMVLDYLTAAAQELDEPTIHALLSRLVEAQKLPPMIPMFIGSYIGLEETPNGLWWASSGGSMQPIKDMPAAYILMENLKPRIIGSLATFLEGTLRPEDPHVSTWLTCLAAGLVSANVQCEFMHCDLHPSNVLICRVPVKRVGFKVMSPFSLADRSYPAQRNYMCDVANGFPIMIDFGMSTMVHRKGRTAQRLQANPSVNVQTSSTFTYRTKDGHPLHHVEFNDFTRLLLSFPQHHPFIQAIGYHPAVRPYLERVAVKPSVTGISPKDIVRAAIPMGTILFVALETFARRIPLTEDMKEDDNTWIYTIEASSTWERMVALQEMDKREKSKA